MRWDGGKEETEGCGGGGWLNVIVVKQAALPSFVPLKAWGRILDERKWVIDLRSDVTDDDKKRKEERFESFGCSRDIQRERDSERGFGIIQVLCKLYTARERQGETKWRKDTALRMFASHIWNCFPLTGLFCFPKSCYLSTSFKSVPKYRTFFSWDVDWVI